MDSLKTEAHVALAENNTMDIDHNTNVNTSGIVIPANSGVVVSDKYEQTHNYYYPQPVNTSKNDWNLLKTQVIETEDSVEIESIENTVLQQIQKLNTTIDDIEGALEVLLELSMKFERPRLAVINIILDLMQNYPQELTIHDLSLSILIRLKEWIRPIEFKKDFENIIEKSIYSMETFPNSEKLFKTFLNMLDVCGWDSKLQENISFRCIKLICEGLYLFNNNSIRVKSFEVILPLLQYLTDDQLADIGTENRFQRNHFDLIMKGNNEEVMIALDTWIVLSSNQKVANSLANEYVDWLITLLEKHSQNMKLVSKILPIIEYIARLENAAKCILTHNPTIEILLLLVKENDVVISYLSVSILSYAIFRCVTDDKMEKINSAITKATLKWYFPKGEIITKYNSFGSLEMMIKNTECNDGIQLFVAWTLHYLCCTDSEYYLRLLRKENLLPLLLKMLNEECILPQVKANYEQVVGLYVNYFNISLCIDDLCSTENFLTLLERALKEDKIISLLQTFEVDFLKKLCFASIQRALKILLSICENHKNSMSVLKIIISCFDVITNKFEGEITTSEWENITRCTFLSTKLFPRDNDIITALLNVLKTSTSHLKNGNKQLVMEFSLLDELKTPKIDNELQLDYVDMTSHFLSLTLVFNDKSEIVDNCMECVVNSVSRITTNELNTLISKEIFRRQIYLLVDEVLSYPNEFKEFTEKLFVLLHRLLLVKTMRKFWSKESNLEVFFQFFEIEHENNKFLQNEATLKIIIQIIIVFATTDVAIRKLISTNFVQIKRLLESDYHEDTKFYVLSLLVLSNGVKKKLLIPLCKLNFTAETYPSPYSLPFICNNLLRHDCFEVRLYAETVLMNIAKQAPIELKRKLVDFGDFDQFLTHFETSVATESNEIILNIFKDTSNHISTSDLLTENSFTFTQIKSVLQNPIAESEDIQRCLHLIRNKWLESITTDDIDLVIKIMDNYTDVCSIQREGLSTLCSLVKSDDQRLVRKIFDLFHEVVKKFKNCKQIIDCIILYTINVPLELFSHYPEIILDVLDIISNLLISVNLTSTNISNLLSFNDRNIYLSFESVAFRSMSKLLSYIKDDTSPDLILCFLKYYNAYYFLQTVLLYDEYDQVKFNLIEKYANSDKHKDIRNELILNLAFYLNRCEYQFKHLTNSESRMNFRMKEKVIYRFIEKNVMNDNILCKLAAISCVIGIIKYHEQPLENIFPNCFDIMKHIKNIPGSEIKIIHKRFLCLICNYLLMSDLGAPPRKEEFDYFLKFCAKFILNDDLKPDLRRTLTYLVNE